MWKLGLLLFGLHLLVIGYLAYRSSDVPRILGALIAIAGVGYVVDSLGAMLTQGSWTEVSSFTFIGEFLLALWLVIWGRRLTSSASGLDEDTIAVARRSRGGDLEDRPTRPTASASVTAAVETNGRRARGKRTSSPARPHLRRSGVTSATPAVETAAVEPAAVEFATAMTSSVGPVGSARFPDRP